MQSKIKSMEHNNKHSIIAPVNKKVLTGRVSVNKKLFTGTVPVNKELLVGTMHVNNLFLKLPDAAFTVYRGGAPMGISVTFNDFDSIYNDVYLTSFALSSSSSVFSILAWKMTGHPDSETC